MAVRRPAASRGGLRGQACRPSSLALHFRQSRRTAMWMVWPGAIKNSGPIPRWLSRPPSGDRAAVASIGNAGGPVESHRIGGPPLRSLPVRRRAGMPTHQNLVAPRLHRCGHPIADRGQLLQPISQWRTASRHAAPESGPIWAKMTRPTTFSPFWSRFRLTWRGPVVHC